MESQLKKLLGICLRQRERERERGKEKGGREREGGKKQATEEKVNNGSELG